MTEILAAEGIKMHFPFRKGMFWRRQAGVVKAVDGVSLSLNKGETLGLVGESGCGKSTLGRCLIRLYHPTAGSITINNTDITGLTGDYLRRTRCDFQMIFQDPYASLNPRMTVFDIIAEPLRTHNLVRSSDEMHTQVNDLMVEVGLSPRYTRKYPHEFSGGQRQRIAVARALAVRPKVIVCDEPVSALDVSIQAQVLNLLKSLQAQYDLSFVFIAHDIAAVRYISNRIAVMYLGKIVELADRDQIFASPKHPYTQALLSAVPIADPRKERSRKRLLIDGDLPSPMNSPSGCAFHTRCPYAQDRCRTEAPALRQVSGQEVACHYADNLPAL